MKKWWGQIAVLLVLCLYSCTVLLRPMTVYGETEKISVPSAKKLQSIKLGINKGAYGYIDSTTGKAFCRPLSYDSKVVQSTASLAKLITVQVILERRPVKAGASGPTITITADDVARFQDVLSKGGSFATVFEGEKISERQMLEGILLASSNNMADSLAIWAYGSIKNYHAAATKWLKNNNLSNTVIGDDASGFNAGTESNPVDLCKIALLASKKPIINEILSEKQAALPSGDVLTNTNRLVGTDGVIGGKTGYTEEAGHGVVLIAHKKIDDTVMTVSAITMGNDDYNSAFTNSQRLLNTTTDDIATLRIDANQKVGSITTAWGEKSDIVASHSLAAPYWVDKPPKLKTELTGQIANALSPDTVIGRLKVGDDSLNLVNSKAIKPASLGWRLVHPL